MPSYTKEFKQKIINEYNNGKSIIQINKKTNISSTTIYKWLRISHTPLKTRKYSKEFKQQVIQEYTNGKSINQIAKENNMPGPTIYDWIKPPKIKAANLILEMKEIESYQLLEISQLSPKQQAVALSRSEATQNIFFHNVPDIEQQCSLSNTNPKISNQIIDFINNLQNFDELLSYNSSSNPKITNL